MTTLLIALVASSLGCGIGYSIRALQEHLTKTLPWYERPTTLCKQCNQPRKLHGFKHWSNWAGRSVWSYMAPLLLL